MLPDSFDIYITIATISCILNPVSDDFQVLQIFVFQRVMNSAPKPQFSVEFPE